MNDVYEGLQAKLPNPPAAYGVPSEPPLPTPPNQDGVPVSPPLPGYSMPPAGQGSAPQPSGGSKLAKVLLAVAVVIIIGLVGAIGFLLTSRDEQTADSSAEATVSSDEGLPPAARLPVPDSVPVDPDSLTETQQRAAAEAKAFLDVGPDSRQSTIEWLTGEYSDEVFSEEDAIAGVDSLGVDWEANAKYWAEFLISENDGYSRLGLLTSLTGTSGHGFTVDQATKAVDSMTIDWDAEAVKYATGHTDSLVTSRAWLLYVMTEEGSEDFTAEQAAAAIDGLNIDWNAQAAEAAKSTLKANPDTGCEEMIEYLEGNTQMFEPDQARHGAEAAGVC